MNMPPKALGSSDYWAGASDSENPFPEGSAEYLEWKQGWIEASDDDAADDWFEDDDVS